MLTKQTITPKNMLNNTKSGEINRLISAMEMLNIQAVDIAKQSGLSARTVTTTIYDNKPIGAQLLRFLNSEYNVSIDWLVSGVGSMFIGDANIEVAETPAVYLSNTPPPDFLIKEYDTVDSTTFADHLMLVARSIEESMQQSGAKPVVDYGYVDLYKMALQVTLNEIKKGGVKL